MTNMGTPKTNQLAWRGKQPGLFEFNTLLNALEKPALVVDLNRKQIFSVNSALLKLTAYSPLDLINAQLSTIIPEFTSSEDGYAPEIDSKILRYQREPLPIRIQMTCMDAVNQLYLLTLTPVADIEQAESVRQRRKELYSALEILAGITSFPDLDTSLKQALHCCQMMTGADSICIFQAAGDSPHLNNICEIIPEGESPFPSNLSSTNLIRLHEPMIWSPGKRVNSELHRAARIANLTYLATIPLGQEGALMGLLVIGDHQMPPAEELLPIAEIASAAITSALQYFIYTINTRINQQKLNTALNIENVLIDHAEEGMIIIDHNQSIISMNPAAELILGYDSSEVVGKDVRTILIGSETLEPAFNAAFENIPTHNLGTVTLHRRQGQAFMAHIQTLPIIEEGKADNIAIILADVSENEQIRLRTQQLEQRALLGNVTAIFAHEVRNPINNISTGLQLIAMKLNPDDPNQELISKLEHDCNRLTQLMESVLSFSRPMEYKMQPTELHGLLKQLLDRWTPRFVRNHIQLYFQPPRGKTFVNGDFNALEQVFTNLISNAVTAMGNTGGGMLAIKITVLNSTSEFPQVEITVSDTGPGISDEVREHIFEPFFTASPNGTGLGLAITKRIVTAHKGNISVNSFPGGTVFHICMPLLKIVEEESA